MGPLVSILIPAYNAQQWLAETIESALAQTWPRKEIIVVNDGSTDRTAEVARRYASRSVEVVTQANQGASGARNTAFSVCQGDYIQWLDADDLLDREKIELQMREVATKGLGARTLLSGAWGQFMYRRRKAWFVPTSLWADLAPLEWMVHKMDENLHMQTDNWLVSRELSLAAGPWDARLWRDNDGEYFCRVIMASDGTRFVPAAKSYYRAAGYRSVSYIGGSNRKLESLFLSMTLHMRYLRSLEDSARTRRACARYIRTWLHEFYLNRMDLVTELKRTTEELGEQFDGPTLSWKYNWLVHLFGWSAARRAQLLLPRFKWTMKIGWDRHMRNLEERMGRTSSVLQADPTSDGARG